MEKRVILGCVVGLLAGASVATAAPQPTRTVILLDESGSMKKNDPDRLSLDATRLFTELGLEQDQIAVVAFADRPRVLVPMSPARAPATKKAVRRALDRLKFDGRTTDIESGLMAALDLLEPAKEGTRDSVVVLTDGKVDLGPSSEAAVRASLERMRVKVAPLIAERGARAYTIAFTEEADQTLMRGLARATRGEYRYLPHAAALAGAFAEMFTSAGDLETLPMRDGAFITDPNIEQTSLVLSKTAPGDTNTLRTPNDVLVTKDSKQKGVEWASSEAYDHITLTQPQAGPWAVDTPPGAAAPVAMITASELEFVASVAPDAPVEGQALVVRAELRRGGAISNSFELHDGLTVSAHVAPDNDKERTVQLERVRDGGYEARVEGLVTGRVAIYVRAQSPSIEREKRILLDVGPKPPEPPPATTVVEVKTTAGVWPYVAAGILVLALAGLGFGFKMRSRWRAALAALAEAEAKPPPAPKIEYVDKAILLGAEDMKVLLPHGGDGDRDETLEAVASLRPEIAELEKHQAAIQAAIDIVMNATVEVTTGLGGLGGAEGLPEEIAARRDALLGKMREVDDQIGALCDGSMNLAEQVQKTNERLSVVLEEDRDAAEPLLTHFEINEVILSRADAQTREEFERLRQELLDRKTQVAVPEVEDARAELDAKAAEMAELKTQFDELSQKNGKLETQLDELTTEYQRIFNEVNG